jgi:ribonuclease Z
LTGWLGPVWGRRSEPFHVVAPVGAKNLEKACALDIKIRIEDEKLPPQGIAVTTDEFDKDGVVYEKDGVTVTAFEVDHGAAIKPAYGYRVEYKGRSVTISGDTRYNQNVIKYGTGIDLLIHEAAIARPELMSNLFAQAIIAHHTSPREAGQVFSQATPRLAACTHLVFLSMNESPRQLSTILWRRRARPTGPLEVGEDLMSFEIGDKIIVRRYTP